MEKGPHVGYDGLSIHGFRAGIRPATLRADVSGGDALHPGNLPFVAGDGLLCGRFQRICRLAGFALRCDGFENLASDGDETDGNIDEMGAEDFLEAALWDVVEGGGAREKGRESERDESNPLPRR